MTGGSSKNKKMRFSFSREYCVIVTFIAPFLLPWLHLKDLYITSSFLSGTLWYVLHCIILAMVNLTFHFVFLIFCSFPLPFKYICSVPCAWLILTLIIHQDWMLLLSYMLIQTPLFIYFFYYRRYCHPFSFLNQSFYFLI